MKKRISQAELNIMDVLWDSDAELLAKSVMAKVPDHIEWSEATVKTLLRRLAEKGFVTHRPDGRRFLYKAVISRSEYAERATNQLIDRLFGGKFSTMIAQMADSRGLSDKDIQDLEALIKAHNRD